MACFLALYFNYFFDVKFETFVLISLSMSCDCFFLVKHVTFPYNFRD